MVVGEPRAGTSGSSSLRIKVRSRNPPLGLDTDRPRWELSLQSGQGTKAALVIPFLKVSAGVGMESVQDQCLQVGIDGISEIKKWKSSDFGASPITVCPGEENSHGSRLGMFSWRREGSRETSELERD